MIEHLIHCTVLPAGNLEQLLHILRIQVGHAPALNFTCSYQCLHAFNGFFQGDIAPPVQQIQVQMVGAQTFQAVFTAAGKLPLSGIMRIHLGDQKDVITDAADSLTNQFLGAPVPVHFSGIDQVHAEFHTQAQGCNFLGSVRCSFSYIPGALPDSRE
ncbi:hypothetical protein D3C80_1229920 [compost metagenome]